MAEPFLGEIKMFAGTFAPRDWAFCAGQLLSIAENQALFSLLGTNYGGDGRTSFGLPDLRGRVAVGAGTGPGLTPKNPGQKSGTETNTLAVPNLPSHSHAAVSQGKAVLNAASGNGTSNNPSGRALATAFADRVESMTYSDTAPTVPMHEQCASVSVTTEVGNTGTNSPVNNMQPYDVVNYIICVNGLYPSRN